MSEALARLLREMDELKRARDREKAGYEALGDALQRLQAALLRLNEAQRGELNEAQRGEPRVLH